MRPVLAWSPRMIFERNIFLGFCLRWLSKFRVFFFFTSILCAIQQSTAKDTAPVISKHVSRKRLGKLKVKKEFIKSCLKQLTIKIIADNLNSLVQNVAVKHLIVSKAFFSQISKIFFLIIWMLFFFYYSFWYTCTLHSIAQYFFFLIEISEPISINITEDEAFSLLENEIILTSQGDNRIDTFETSKTHQSLHINGN